MKASELRIGNLVYSQLEVENGINLPVLVIGVDTNHVTYLSQNHRIHSEIRPFQAGLNQIYPIPLTKVWLEGIGFKDSRLLLPGDGELEIRLLSHTFHIWPHDREAESHNYRNHLSYVHQLQNLHFTLTGDELTLRE